MPPLVLLFQIIIAAIVLTFAAFFLLILAAVGVVLAVVAFILHKLGWDRKLLAYVMARAGVRVHVSNPVKVQFDDMDEPIDARWVDDGPTRERLESPAPRVVDIELSRPETPRESGG